MASQHGRDALELDRGGNGVALAGHSPQQGLPKSELRKATILCSTILCSAIPASMAVEIAGAGWGSVSARFMGALAVDPSLKFTGATRGAIRWATNGGAGATASGASFDRGIRTR